MPGRNRLDVRRLAIHGALRMAGQNVVVRAISFLGNLVTARILLPREFGVLALGLTITTVIGVAGSIGIGAALVRGSREPTDTELGFIEGLQLLVPLVAITILCGLIPLFGTTVEVGAVMLIILLVRFRALTQSF